MSALGSLVVSLSLEYAQYTKGLDKSSQEALKFARGSQKAFDSASNALGNMVKGVLAAGAAYLTLSKGIEAINDSISGLASLDDLSQKTGSSVENLSKMQKVAKQFGGDFAAVDTAVSKLAKGMASVDSEASNAHRALKALNLNDFSKTHDASEVMVEVAKRLQEYKDSAGKAALANDLFGKSGADLLPYLNDLAENYDSMTGASAKAAKQAADFQDRLGGLKLKVGELFQNLAIDLLPTLNDVAGAINDSLNASRDLKADKSALNWADELALAGARVYDTFANVAALVKALMGSFKVVYADIKVLGEASKLANPGALAASIASGNNPYKNLDLAKSARDKTLAEANAGYESLLSADRSAAENALLARFSARPLNARNAAIARRAGSGLSELDYKTGNAPSSGNNEAANAARRLNDQRLKDLQDLIDTEREEYDAINQYKAKKEEEVAKEKAEMQKAWAEVEQRNIDAAQREREKAFEQEQRNLEKLADEQRTMAHEFSQALTNGLFDSFKKGESFGRAMLSNLLALAKTWAVRLLDGILAPIGSSIAAVFTGGAASVFSGSASAASSGGSSSIFSGLSSIGNLFSNGNAAIVSSIESLGTFLSTGTGGLGDLLGGALGQYASQIANVLPFAGAAFSLLTGDIKGAISQGVGAGIGLAIGGPVGGIVGAVAGSLLGGLGGEHVIRKKFYANASVTSSGASILNAYGNSDTSGSEAGFAVNPTLAFADAILQYAKAFDASVNKFTLGVNYQQKYNAYLLTIGAATTGANKDFSFTADKSADGAAQAFLIAVKKGLVVLPDYIMGILKKSTLDINAAQANIQLLADIKKIGEALKDLPPVFDAIDYSLKNSITLKNVDLLKNQFASVGTYTSLFYTQAEQFDTFTKQMQSQFSALDSVMPQSRDEYRALVDGINVTNDATSKLFYGLVALAPAMDNYFKQLESQRLELNKLVDSSYFSTSADYASAAANSAIGLSYTGNIGEINTTRRTGDAGLIAVIRQLVSSQASTQAVLEAVAVAVQETARIQKIWNGDGLPETRVI